MLNGSALFQTEGTGKAGSSPPPWPPCVEIARGRNHRFGRDFRPSLRDGVNAYTRSPRGPAFLPPLSATMLRIIASATMRRRIARGISTGMPGPHDFTSAPCRSSAHETHAATHRVHRIPLPTSVTIAIRPLSGTERGHDNADLGKAPSYLCFSEVIDFRKQGRFARRASQTRVVLGFSHTFPEVRLELGKSATLSFFDLA